MSISMARRYSLCTGNLAVGNAQIQIEASVSLESRNIILKEQYALAPGMVFFDDVLKHGRELEMKR